MASGYRRCGDRMPTLRTGYARCTLPATPDSTHSNSNHDYRCWGGTGRTTRSGLRLVSSHEALGSSFRFHHSRRGEHTCAVAWRRGYVGARDSGQPAPRNSERDCAG